MIQSEMSRRHTEKTSPKEKSSSVLLELLNSSSEQSPAEIDQKIAAIVSALQEKEVAPELAPYRDTLVQQLQMVTRQTLLALRQEYQRLHPGKSYREQAQFKSFFSRHFSEFFTNEIARQVDLDALTPLIGVHELGSPEKRARLAFPWKVALFLFFVTFLLSGGTNQVEAQDAPPHTEGGEAEAYDLLTIGFELGQASNPYLLWPLLEPDSNGNESANIFEDLLIQSSNYSGNPIVVTGPVLERFAITQQQALEILIGYTLGFWNPETELQPYLNTLSVVILTDSQSFIDICGIAAGACFRDYPEPTVYFPADIASATDAPHEAAHGLAMASEIWPSPSPTEIATSEGFIRTEVVRHAGTQGLGLVDQDGRIAVVDFLYIKESLAELLSTAQANSMNLEESEIYSVDDEVLAVPEAYRHFTNRLGTDPALRAEFVDALRNKSMFDTMELTGRIIREAFPDYSARIWAHLAYYPNLEDEYYFNFNMTRYDSVQVLQQLPEDLQAGVLLWGELSSMVRVYISDHPAAFEDEDLTLVARSDMDGKTFFGLTDLQSIYYQEVIADSYSDRFITPEYRWGQTTEVVGDEQVLAWVTEYRETGTVQLTEDVNQLQVVSAILEYQVTEKFGDELSYYFRDNLENAVRSLQIELSERSEAELPYEISRQDNPFWLVGTQLSDLMITTTVTTDQPNWVQDSLWAAMRTSFEYGFTYQTYTALPTRSETELISDFFDPSGVVLLEKYTVEEGEVSVSLTDVSQLRDLGALMMVYSLGGQTEEELRHLDPMLQEFVQGLDENGMFNRFWGNVEASNYYTLLDIGHGTFFREGDVLEMTLERLQELSGTEQFPWLQVRPVTIDAGWATSDPADPGYAQEVLASLQTLSAESDAASWEIFYRTGVLDTLRGEYPELFRERG